MAIELRCEGDLYGVLSDDMKSMEVKCHRRGCGARKGTIVLHTISLETGKVVHTQRFREPQIGKEHHGTGNQRTAVRSASGEAHAHQG